MVIRGLGGEEIRNDSGGILGRGDQRGVCAGGRRGVEPSMFTQ